MLTPKGAVLYVHGMSFPAALSIAHRFDGRSWRDELCNRGFHVWGLDFYGFGSSDRYAKMSQPAELNAPLGQAEEASGRSNAPRDSLRSTRRAESFRDCPLRRHDSAGTIATALFAIRNPELVDRLVFFAPIARREPKDAPRHPYPAWRQISLQDQWQRFTGKVPEGQPPVLAEEHFRDWSQRYLKTDPDSGLRSPPSVKTPTGIIQEIAAAWAGQLGYDPTRIHAPVAIIRGEWDRMCTDAMPDGCSMLCPARL